jgi:host factor-I protein
MAGIEDAYPESAPAPNRPAEPAKPAARSQSVQETFLNHVRKNKVPLTVFLVNGVKLQGILTWFDNFSLLLKREAHSQLVYKHAISTIMPAVPIQLFEQGNGTDNGDEPEPAPRRPLVDMRRR